ncbi:MAG: galactose mutarotase [Chitinispirillaceae bacterium]|nr:galactose mutarotase [Chitinispirillaceae bacterium]
MKKRAETVLSRRRCAAGAAALIGAVVLSPGCQKKETPPPQAKPASTLNVAQSFYGQTPEGDSITLYTLTDGKGMEAKLITYGATLVSLKVPDRNGVYEDVILGYDSLEGYIGGTSYIGASIGRYANRIGKAKFELDGVTYAVTKNDGENHLHGGAKGFHKVVWKASPFTTDDSVGVTFTYFSKDGEEGFPGNLTATSMYVLKADNSLTNVISAATDKNTHANVTHHSYFNLTGGAKRDILDHELTIVADNYTPVDNGLIPTGEIAPVKETDLDFTEPMAVGSRIQNVKGGYDHNFILNKEGTALTLAARMYEPESGRVMEVYSTEPAIQFYSGNFLDGTIVGKGGKTYPKYYGFCLEPQHYPDSPNKPAFPTTLLKAGEALRNVMVFKFSTR